MELKNGEIMTKEEIIDNIARLNSETWRDREEVRAEIGQLLAELKKALEKEPVYFPLCADCKQKMNEIRRAYNMDEIKKPCDKMKNRAFCGDAVSRKAILKEIPVLWNSSGDKDYCMETLIDFVTDLSPVTPAQCIAEVRFSKEDLREICNERIEIECTHGTCKDCKYWKDSDGLYRRGIGAESKCTFNNSRVFDGNFYCADFEKRGINEKDRDKINE